MALDLTLGRAGQASTAGGDGLFLYCDRWEFSGDQASVGGFVKDQALADLKALRDQLTGLGPNNYDEPVIPVTWVQDPTVDGFYRVEKVDVPNEITGRLSPTSTGIGWKFKIELRKVGSWAVPLHELVCGGTARSNVYGIAIGTTIPIVAAPVGAFSMTPAFESSTTRTGADGAVNLFYDSSTPTTFTLAPTWKVAPADTYKGACRIEASYDSGATWRTVTGRQIRNVPTRWRVANSLVRATATTTASKTELSVEHYDGSQWDTAKVYQLTQDTSYTAYAFAPTSITVHANSADEVRVQLGMGTTAHATLDVRLRRGSRGVEGFFSHPTLTDLGVRRGTNEAATALTTACGLRATADSDGNKYVIATPQTLAGTDTTIGAIRVSSSTFAFVISTAIGGTVGTAINETMGEASAYFAALNHYQNTVAV